MKNKTYLAILSGGQDSVTALLHKRATEPDAILHAVTFLYGQRHAKEANYAKMAGEKARVRTHKFIDLVEFFPQLVKSALTDPDRNINSPHPDHPELPASFVPNRNGLFILLAHSRAQLLGVETLIGGFCQTDYSGYPDCRAVFLVSFIRALNIGADAHIGLHTPLLELTKAETFALANRFGFLTHIKQNTMTCYNGVEEAHHWGFGCGDCAACKLRRDGWLQFKATYLDSDE